MQTSQASFLLPCETQSTNHYKRLDRFLFLLSAPSYQSITQEPLYKITYSLSPPLFLGRGKQEWGMGKYLEFPEHKVVPMAQDPCQHLVPWVCILLSPVHISGLWLVRSHVCFSAQKLPEDLWKFTLIFPRPSGCLDLSVSFLTLYITANYRVFLSLLSHYLLDG